MLCDVKMRKTQGSPQKQQLSKAGDKNEFRTFFFSFLNTKEKSKIYLHSAVRSGVTLSKGEEHAIPLHSDENIPSFLT